MPVQEVQKEISQQTAAIAANPRSSEAYPPAAAEHTQEKAMTRWP